MRALDVAVENGRGVCVRARACVHACLGRCVGCWECVLGSQETVAQPEFTGSLDTELILLRDGTRVRSCVRVQEDEAGAVCCHSPLCWNAWKLD